MPTEGSSETLLASSFADHCQAGQAKKVSWYQALCMCLLIALIKCSYSVKLKLVLNVQSSVGIFINIK